MLRRTCPLFLEPLEVRTLLSTFFVVNSCDSGEGRCNYGDLRYCITQANATPGANVIDFAIPGQGVQTIHLHSPLPALTNSVTLDGWSQGGAGYTGAPLVELDGRKDCSDGSGLTIEASKCVVRGLAFNDFGGYGLVVAEGSANDYVYGCYFGVTLDGLRADPNAAGGVYLGGTNTLLGTDTQLGTDALPGTNANGVPTDAQRNLISGNRGYGVTVAGSGNTIAGNRIGLDADGSTELGNDGAGVLVSGANNTIGGAAPGAGNVISANRGSGILIDGTSATGNVVQGNNIGTDASGMSGRGNTGDGIVVTDGASDNTLGGRAAGERNVLSGNSGAGVALGRFTAAGTDNRVLGNYIGVNADGTAVLGNGFEGVLINDGSSGERIGGSGPGEGNVISGNGLFGLNIINATKNTVQGNLIGVLPDGRKAAPNALGGVVIQITFLKTTGNRIGGTTDGAGNLISGNTGPGVLLSGEGVTGNVVAGNGIGTTAAGAPLGNAGDGVRLDGGASQNTIGGDTPSFGNVIAFNAKGVVVAGKDSTGDSILGNSVFGNAGLGIDLGDDGPTANGTSTPGPNHFQPHPVLLSLEDDRITGSLSAAANTTYRIELFASPASGPAGQGQTFLGSVLVTTGTDGRASFTLAVSLSPGEVVTATATDLATGDTSEFSGGKREDKPPKVTVADNGASLLENVGQFLSLKGSFSDPDSEQWKGTIDYGDGLGVHPLVLGPDRTFRLNHVYQQEGNYTVTVTITDDGGASGSISIPIEVFDAGVDITQIRQGTAPPGGSATMSLTNMSAVMFRDATDDPSAPASLLCAPLTASLVQQLGGGSALGGPGMITMAYDMRSVAMSAKDRAVITFQYPPGGGHA